MYLLCSRYAKKKQYPQTSKTVKMLENKEKTRISAGFCACLQYKKDIFDKSVKGAELSYVLYFVGEADIFHIFTIHYYLLLPKNRLFVFSEE